MMLATCVCKWHFRYATMSAIFVMIAVRGQWLKMIHPRIICAQGHLRKLIFKLLHMNQEARKDSETLLLYSSAIRFEVLQLYQNDHLLLTDRERIFNVSDTAFHSLPRCLLF